MLTFGLLFLSVSAIIDWKTTSLSIEKFDKLLFQYGKNNEGNVGRMKGYHSQKPLRSFDIFNLSTRTPLQARDIIMNQTWKQNLRK
jgi:hypothetical protein